MRQIVGKRVVELPTAQVAARQSGYAMTVLDVGTGDGKHVLREARAHPDRLVIGLDANRDNMAKVAQRAAARPEKGGAPNAVFVWAAAEQVPDLVGIDEIHVLMPWGSLLRGMLGAEPIILTELARVARPGAELLCTLNLHAWRPPVREVGDTPEPTPDWALTGLAPRYAELGWNLTDAAYLNDADDAIPLTTAWSRRLTSSRDQLDVLILRATRG